MVIKSTLVMTKDQTKSKRDRGHAKYFAVRILCELLKTNTPIPKDLSEFCADHIPKLLKIDMRGAKQKYDHIKVFNLYRQLAEIDGLTDKEAKKKVLEKLSKDKLREKSAIFKIIDKEKEFLALMKKINGME